MEEQTVSSRRMCGAAAAYYLAVESHPEYRQGQREVEIATAQMMAAGPETLIPDEPITIPLVAHVVYNDESANISEEQIESQIAVLNQDFAATNPNTLNVLDVWEGFVTDTNIRFALASEDPDGNSTTGAAASPYNGDKQRPTSSGITLTCRISGTRTILAVMVMRSQIRRTRRDRIIGRPCSRAYPATTARTVTCS